MTTFKKLSLPTATLPYALGINDANFPLGFVDKTAYSSVIAIDDHTWVTVSDGANTEVIKLGTPDYLGSIPILQRGAIPVSFLEGACVSYGWTDEAIADLYPESGLDFVDACGEPTKCACDVIPKTWILNQLVSIVIPYSGAPTGRTVTANITGVSSSTSASAVTITGTPSVAGTYNLALKISKGGLSRTMNCSIVVVDPAIGSNGSGSC
jgi:hypothetical protein